MVIFDSNIWIAWLNKTDSQHSRAEEIAATAIFPVGLPEYVLIEVATVLGQRVGKKTADQFLAYVWDNRDIIVLPSNPEMLHAVIKLFCAGVQRGLSFVDVSLVWWAQQRYTVVTFDMLLQKALRNANINM